MSATAEIAEQSTQLRPSCSEARYEVSRADLPVCCPHGDMTLWDAHPKVYLPLDENGEAHCPYCGAVHALKD